MNEVTQPVRARRTMLSAVAAVAALAALLALAPFASAASDPLASGTTTITLNKGLFKKLKKAGVKVLKVSPAKVNGRKVTLPVSGGALDPTNGQGTVEHNGGIKFKHGKKSAVVKVIELNTTANSLKANVAGKKMKLATVSGVTVARNGFGANVSIGKLKLTGNAAKQLNKKLGFGGKGGKKSSASTSKSKGSQGPFKGNQVLGGSTSETQPKTVTVLPGGEATLLTNLETVGKFVSLKVELEPIAPATEKLALPPSFFFPISGGTIAPNGLGGTVQTSGGVKLTQEPVLGLELTMTLEAIWVDLSARTATVEVDIESSNPELVKTPGKLGRSSIANLDLNGATIVSDPSAHTVSISNATASLQGVTAAVLNEVFAGKAEVFKEGDPLGTFSFTAQTQ